MGMEAFFFQKMWLSNIYNIYTYISHFFLKVT